MRVIRVIGGLREEWGGPSVSSVHSTIAAQRHGIQNTFCFPAFDLDHANRQVGVRRMRDEGIDVRIFRLRKGSLRARPSSRYCVSLQRYLTAEAGSCDVMHFHGGWEFPVLFTSFWLRRPNAVTVLTPHEALTESDVMRGSRAKAILKRFVRNRIRGAVDGIVYSSDLERVDSAGSGHPLESAIHHPVFDEQDHHADVPPTHRPLGSDRLVLGFLGRVHPKKRLDIIVRALARLPGNVVLRVAGAGDTDYTDGLKRLAADCGVSSRIEWLGFAHGDDKYDFLSSIDVNLMPSDYECFGVSAVEALSQGVPVVVSENTGVAPAIGEDRCGAVIPVSADALANALDGAVADGARVLSEWASRAQPVARKHFSYQSHAVALAAFYDTLCSR